MEDTICQECGKELDSWSERHTYEDCQNYLLAKKLAGLHSLQREWNEILKGV